MKRLFNILVFILLLPLTIAIGAVFGIGELVSFVYEAWKILVTAERRKD